MSASTIAHATRDSKKEKNLIVSDTDLASFPQANASRRMDLYYDSRTGSFRQVGRETETRELHHGF